MNAKKTPILMIFILCCQILTSWDVQFPDSSYTSDDNKEEACLSVGSGKPYKYYLSRHFDPNLEESIKHCPINLHLIIAAQQQALNQVENISYASMSGLNSFSTHSKESFNIIYCLKESECQQMYDCFSDHSSHMNMAPPLQETALSYIGESKNNTRVRHPIDKKLYFRTRSTHKRFLISSNDQQLNIMELIKTKSFFKRWVEKYISNLMESHCLGFIECLEVHFLYFYLNQELGPLHDYRFKIFTIQRSCDEDMDRTNMIISVKNYSYIPLNEWKLECQNKLPNSYHLIASCTNRQNSQCIVTFKIPQFFEGIMQFQKSMYTHHLFPTTEKNPELNIILRAAILRKSLKDAKIKSEMHLVIFLLRTPTFDIISSFRNILAVEHGGNRFILILNRIVCNKIFFDLFEYKHETWITLQDSVSLENTWKDKKLDKVN